MVRYLKVMLGKTIIGTVTGHGVYVPEPDISPRIYSLGAPKDYKTFIEWIEDRVPPRNRVGIQKELDALGLELYDEFVFAVETHAYLMEDDFWLATSPDDKWEDGLRAKAGFKPYPEHLIFGKS